MENANIKPSGKPDAVPYIVFEDAMVRNERQVKRLWIALIIAIIACVAIFAGHIWYLNQYDFTSYEQDGEGVNIIGDGNGVDYDVPAGTFQEEEEPQFGEGPSNAEAP